MKYPARIYYTDTDKSLMWDRWQKGESLNSIARHFGRSGSGTQSCPDEPRSTAYPLFRPRHQDAAADLRAPRLNHAIEFPILCYNIGTSLSDVTSKTYVFEAIRRYFREHLKP